MPTLDITEVLHGSDIVEEFVVRRRNEVVGSNGRSSVVESSIRTHGVVTSASPNDLERLPEDQVMTRSISIVCQFKLRGETDQYQPDVVEWRGSNYLVNYVDYYPQFGQGFIQAICSSMDNVDPVMEVSTSGGLYGNLRSNSLNIAVLR